MVLKGETTRKEVRPNDGERLGQPKRITGTHSTSGDEFSHNSLFFHLGSAAATLYPTLLVTRRCSRITGLGFTQPYRQMYRPPIMYHLTRVATEWTGTYVCVGLTRAEIFVFGTKFASVESRHPTISAETLSFNANKYMAFLIWSFQEDLPIVPPIFRYSLDGIHNSGCIP